MRRALVLVTACLLLLAVPAHAGDEPTVEELARMVLHGTDAEQALVATWLDKADRGKLVALFRAVRALRGTPPESKAPEVTEPTQALVNMQVRFIDIPVDKLDLLLGPERPSAQAPTRPMAPAQVERLLRNVEATGGAVQVTAPRITAYDGQKANVHVTNQITYIQDYDIETGRGGKQIADPIVAVIQEGITLELCAKLTADRKAATVAFLGTWAVLQRPIKEKQITVGGQALTIQLPQLDVAKTVASVRMRDGAHVLIGGGMQIDVEGTRVERVALLHVQFFELDKGELRELEQELEAEARKATDDADSELSKPTIEFDTKVLFVPIDQVDALLGAHDKTALQAKGLTDAEAHALLARAQAGRGGVQYDGGARATTLEGKPANVSRLNHISYVRDHEVVEKNGRTFASPVVDTIQEGIVLEMTPRLAPDRGVAIIEFEGTFAAVSRPLATAEKTVNGTQVVVQVPETSVLRARATMKVRDGGWVQLRGPVPEFAKGIRVALVRVKIGTVGDFVRASPGARIKKK